MKITEKEVTIKGEFDIGATVTYTDENKKSPAIVIIMGTGKLDRDGNGAGFHSDIYKDLANLFAEQGFACIRYDKRGTHRSGGSFNAAGLSDLVNDAVSAVRYMKEQAYVDENRVIICGHSEGAMIATLVSEKEDTAGLILLGGAATSLKDALYYQNTLAAEEIGKKDGFSGALLKRSFDLKKQLAMIDDMFEKSSKTDKEKIFVRGAFMPAKWLREHGSYSSQDFADILKKYGSPVLAVTGTADIQADHRNLDLLKEQPHISCYAPERLGHVLRKSDDNISILEVNKDYRRLLKEPIDSELIGIAEDWLRQFCPAR